MMPKPAETHDDEQRYAESTESRAGGTASTLQTPPPVSRLTTTPSGVSEAGAKASAPAGSATTPPGRSSAGSAHGNAYTGQREQAPPGAQQHPTLPRQRDRCRQQREQPRRRAAQAHHPEHEDESAPRSDLQLVGRAANRCRRWRPTTAATAQPISTAHWPSKRRSPSIGVHR